MNLKLGLPESENTGIEPRRLLIIGGFMKQKYCGFIHLYIGDEGGMTLMEKSL